MSYSLNLRKKHIQILANDKLLYVPQQNSSNIKYIFYKFLTNLSHKFNTLPIN